MRPAVGIVLAGLALAGCGGAPQAQSGAAPTASPSALSGAITGSSGFPPSGVAPLLVYAISTAGASHGAYSTETVAGQLSYTINGVAPGEYFVFSA
jgi:hypothetical protein